MLTSARMRGVSYSQVSVQLIGPRRTDPVRGSHSRLGRVNHALGANVWLGAYMRTRAYARVRGCRSVAQISPGRLQCYHYSVSKGLIVQSQFGATIR